ncbi:Leukotriene-B(4) omega-hydroxylase 1, partial [Tetrabaena socialis]
AAFTLAHTHAASSPGAGPTSAVAPDASTPSSSSSASASTEGLVELLVQIEAAAGWLLLQLPLPDRLLPGYGSYVAGTARLDGIVYDMIRRRRREGVADEDRDLLAYLLRAQLQQQQQELQARQQAQTQTQQEPSGAGDGQAGAGSCPHASAATSAAAAASAGGPAARAVTPGEPSGTAGGGGGSEGRGGGGGAITDKQIRDELVTMLFAGTDTSAHTMALTCHHLAACPEAQQAARAEVLEVLAGRAPSQMTSDDVRRLPFLTAALKETMRLYPGGPEVARLVK